MTFLRGEPDWFDLYKAFELMRDDINSKLGQNKYGQMGWPDKKTADEFSESAQVYRHSRAKWPEGYDLSTAMKSDEAREFIQSLARTWLGWRYTGSLNHDSWAIPQWGESDSRRQTEEVRQVDSDTI